MLKKVSFYEQDGTVRVYNIDDKSKINTVTEMSGNAKDTSLIFRDDKKEILSKMKNVAFELTFDGTAKDADPDEANVKHEKKIKSVKILTPKGITSFAAGVTEYEAYGTIDEITEVNGKNGQGAIILHKNGNRLAKFRNVGYYMYY